MNWEFSDVQAGFWRGRGTRDLSANICWIMEKAREFQKNSCFIDYTKTLDCVGHKRLWKILQEMEIPDHLTCLLRNLFAGQEARVRTIQEQKTSSKLGKEYIKTVYFHPAYLTYMQSTWLEILGWRKHKLDQDLSGGALGITDKMEAWPQPPLLIPQAQSQDEGVRFCDSDLFFLRLSWLERTLRCLLFFRELWESTKPSAVVPRK